MTKEEYYAKLITEILKLDKSDIADDNDFDAESQKHILERDKYYSDLLKHFGILKAIEEAAKSEEKKAS